MQRLFFLINLDLFPLFTKYGNMTTEIGLGDYWVEVLLIAI
jgi:hypothetical protein